VKSNDLILTKIQINSGIKRFVKLDKKKIKNVLILIYLDLMSSQIKSVIDNYLGSEKLTRFEIIRL
jgi:2-hydroxy-3-keto-5-methylthiopentenyl-1-phosphate phosphatase